MSSRTARCSLRLVVSVLAITLCAALGAQDAGETKEPSKAPISTRSARDRIRAARTLSESPTRRVTTPRRTTSSPTPVTSRGATGELAPGAADENADESSETSGSAEGAKGAEGDDSAEAESGGFVGFVREYSTWILGGLGLGTVLVLGWAFIGSRRRGRSEAFLEPLDHELEGTPRDRKMRKKGTGERYSSTRIRAADVNARLAEGTVAGETVETSREYALVVEEDALKSSEPDVDPHTGKPFVDDSTIRGRIAASDWEGAYLDYVSRLETDATSEFHGDLEERLSEHFIREADFDKAARVLEHHVATHAREDVKPEAYFNLAFIHFKRRTLNKSRRFFKLYAEHASDAGKVARAQRILETLEAHN